ncbi:hypothetical protein FQR65_LT11795 [Abscondita terminalis]|nr:hypothetical protein FQR65_LT11795 [Abscondita terminalis]
MIKSLTIDGEILATTVFLKLDGALDEKLRIIDSINLTKIEPTYKSGAQKTNIIGFFYKTTRTSTTTTESETDLQKLCQSSDSDVLGTDDDPLEGSSGLCENKNSIITFGKREKSGDSSKSDSDTDDWPENVCEKTNLISPEKTPVQPKRPTAQSF